MRPMRKSVLAILCVLGLAAGACSPVRRATGESDPLEHPSEPVSILVWSSRDLPNELSGRIAAIDGVSWVARISNGMVDLVSVTGASRPLPRRAKGAVFPISIAAMDPTPEGGDAVSAALTAGDAVMSSTAAAMRGMKAGGTITIAADGTRRTFRIGAVVPDATGRGREVLIPRALSKGLGLTATRAIVSSVKAEHVSAAVASIKELTAGVRAHMRAESAEQNEPAESQILSFMEIKRIFGEFTYRPTDGRYVVIDKRWEDANIVQVRIPLLGEIKCNVRIVPQLIGAMRELQRSGLEHLIHTSNGCYSPRMQVGNTYALSRHAYAIAVDINATRNPYGEKPRQDARLIDLMERWGFTWGGRWLVPDGMHFEFVQFVDPASPPPLLAPAPAAGG